jgi:hypothetical protein
MRIYTSFFRIEIYDGGAWFRVSGLGGFSFVDRNKHPQTPYSIRNSKGIVRLFNWTIHRLTEVKK